MVRAMYSAVSGLKNHQTKMDVIGDNIANVNNNAYKSSSVRFQDVYSTTLRNASAGNGTIGGTNPIQVGGGVRVGSIEINFAPANTEPSESGTDVAISGEGFFVVSNLDPDNPETYYTRDGHFTTDGNNMLVNADGYYVLDSEGNQIDCSDIKGSPYINKEGEVRGNDDTGTEISVGTIGLAMFPNPGALARAGGNLYAATPNTGEAAVDVPGGTNGSSKLQMNSLELSNVDLANEFTSMITTQRGYQANSRVITTADSMLEELVNLKR